MTAPQIRVGQVVLQDAQPTGQIRIGDVSLGQVTGPQLRIGTVSLTQPQALTMTAAVAASGGVLGLSMPLPVVATITASDPAGGQLTYSTDWGDGSPASQGTPAYHTYTRAGRYTVVSTVTSTSGQSATSSHQVVVDGSPQRRIFAVKTAAGVRPLLFTGIAKAGRVQPLQFTGWIDTSGVLEDPDQLVEGVSPPAAP